MFITCVLFKLNDESVRFHVPMECFYDTLKNKFYFHRFMFIFVSDEGDFHRQLTDINVDALPDEPYVNQI